MKIVKILLILLTCTFVGTCHPQIFQNDISLAGIGDFTLDSPGHFVANGQVTDRITQSNRNGPGFSLEFRRWLGNHGASLLYSKSPTNSKLSNLDRQSYPWTADIWKIQRHEVDLLYVRRFGLRALQPYLTTGLGAELLNGGPESGLDAQFAYVVGAGEDMRLWRHFGLRSGFTADSIHAPTYQDRTYRSVRTWMLEPRWGITYNFAFRTPPAR